MIMYDGDGNADDNADNYDENAEDEYKCSLLLFWYQTEPRTNQ